MPRCDLWLPGPGILSGPRMVALASGFPGLSFTLPKVEGTVPPRPSSSRSALRLTQALCAGVWGLTRPDLDPKGTEESRGSLLHQWPE